MLFFKTLIQKEELFLGIPNTATPGKKFFKQEFTWKLSVNTLIILVVLQ